MRRARRGQRAQPPDGVGGPAQVRPQPALVGDPVQVRIQGEDPAILKAYSEGFGGQVDISIRE